MNLTNKYRKQKIESQDPKKKKQHKLYFLMKKRHLQKIFLMAHAINKAYATGKALCS